MIDKVEAKCIVFPKWLISLWSIIAIIQMKQAYLINIRLYLNFPKVQDKIEKQNLCESTQKSWPLGFIMTRKCFKKFSAIQILEKKFTRLYRVCSDKTFIQRQGMWWGQGRKSTAHIQNWWAMEVQEPFTAEAWNDLSEELSFGRAQREVLRGVPLKPAVSNWFDQLPRISKETDPGDHHTSLGS